MTQTLHWQKSTFSDGGDGNTCVELACTPAHWQKSSFSGGGEGNDCLELATTSTCTPTTIHLRESEEPATHLTTTPTPLSHLLHHIKTGRLGTPLV